MRGFRGGVAGLFRTLRFNQLVERSPALIAKTQPPIFKISLEEPTQQADLLACTQVLAGLRFEKALLRQLFRKETMRESVIYQEIREDGLLEGRQLGLLEGRKDEALSFLTRQLTRRIGAIAPQISEQIQTLSVEELEDLGEALLDFSEPSDLTNWLSDRQP
ncbi:MAG: DUF4351 domain-containing protein [Microcoleus sp. SU_5_3]|nr:DUF4351 domain-containing protein [Microcoleus sp. SU_5_3]